MEMLLSPYPELMQLPYLQDEVRRIGYACVSVTDSHGEDYIPYIGLLGLKGSDLTESKSIPVLATVVIQYLKKVQLGSQWENFRDGDYQASSVHVEEVLSYLSSRVNLKGPMLKDLASKGEMLFEGEETLEE